MNASWLRRAAVAAGCLLAVSGGALAASATPAPAMAPNGMVVTAQHLATQVGVDVLRRGGNAVDAAVAVGYALAVVYPAAGNLGGGGFMTLQLADGRTTFLDFREKAPRAAWAGMYLDKDGRVIPGASTKGYLAVGVPGSVSGLEYARRKYGTLTRARLLAPAIALADRGFTLDPGDADLLRASARDLRGDAPSAAIFLNQGRPFQPGQ
jgi:gamma-glutamyltranspeptidase/glutathione hydrolase